MQQKQRKKRTALLTGLLTLCTLWMGWGQGLEDFTNLPTNSSGSYQARSWTGTNNVTWTAQGARTDQTIDGKAICFGTSSTRNVTSPTYSGGMGTLTFDYVRAFTGTNARSLEVYVNGNQIGSTITVSTTSDDVITYNEDINVSGDVVLEIRSTGAAQVKLDNISWTGFSGSAPLLTATPTTLTNFEYIEGNGPSASQSFEVSGMNLDPLAGNINVEAPANFEVSLDDNTFADDVDIAYTAGEFTDVTVYVRLKSGLTENTYSGDITISGGGITGNITVALSGEVTPLFIGTIETFANSNATASYNDSSFVGNGGITWAYVESRDANNDANGSGIDLPALMLRRASDDSKITSESIPGGIGDFSVKLYKGFTGSGNRQVELFINGVSQGTSSPFDDYNEHIFAVSGINISGNVVIEIRNITSSQIIIDDIAWTAFSGSAPLLTATPTTLTNFEYIEGSGPSASQSVDVSGINLDPAAGTINVAAPANFEVSLDDNTFADDVDIDYTAGEFTDETVYVRLKSGLAVNTYNGDIIISGGDAADITVAVDGEVTPIPQPELLTDPTSITGLNYMDGNGPSAAQTVTLTGANLNGTQDVIVELLMEAESEFEISQDDITYGDSFTLTNYDGSATDIYVRLKEGLTEDSYGDFILINGYGVTEVEVELDGAVTPFIDQYAGVGVFEQITSTAELEDGYYVIMNTNSEFAMTNIHDGTFLAREAITVVDNTIVNPGIHLAWYIEANGAGYSIYNDEIEKFVSYTGSSNNIQIVDNVTTDNQRWNITYSSGDFLFTNAQITNRRLQYNAGSPRFVAYTGTQQDLQLYKYTIPTDPILTAAPLEITGLDYTVGEGPSTAQPLEVSAINMDGTDVTVSVPAAGAIELAATEGGTYSDEVVLPAFDGDAVNVFVRLKAGLTIGDYSEVITISGGGATDITVNSSGQVTPDFDGMETFENFPVTGGSYLSGDFIGVYGNTWYYVNARGDFQIDNETVTLQHNTSASLNSSIGGGIAAFSFDYMQVFNTNVNLEVYINGNLEATVTSSGEQGVVKNSGIILLGTPVQGVFTIEFKQGTGGGQVAIDNFNWVGVTPTADYTWENGVWSPQTPIDNATATDDILIVNGTAVFNGDIEMNNLYVQNGATLQVENILKVNGNIENNGAIVFVSTSVANTAEFDSFTGSITGNGTVTAERFIPARRAFRLLSSPVTTTGSINANWQEGVNNTGTNFPDDNQNPNPGYGTHITGSTTGANGFDATPSGNPSLFYLDVANQSWEPFANTDNTTIQAGVPHRLMVRGGRDINVTSNSAVPSDTRLRTTGSLHTGPQTQSYTVAAADDLVLFGNPYQAPVDMENVLLNAENVNLNFYYIWDPTLGGIPTPGQPGGRGAYVTVDTDDWTNEEGSVIGQYLQPHQAALVRAAAPGTVEINFAETDKAVGNLVTVFSAPENTAAISLKLYEANAYDQNNTVSDALKIKFATEGNNAIDAYDAIKIGNLDENLAIVNDGNYLSVESRAWPTEDDVISLFINQHRHQDYVFVAHPQGLEGVDAYLRDHYLMEELLLYNDTDTVYAFSVSQDDPNSMATDRFELYFVDATMGVNDVFEGQVVLYPNPSERTFFLQSTALSGKQITVNISNMLGQKVYEQKAQFEDSGRVEVTPQKLPAGVYLVTLQDTQNNTHTIQWIKK